jgi:Cu2+-exporting ATPase
MQAGFCCLGCSSAFDFVNELGLTKFYEVLDRTEINPAATHSDNMTSLFDVDEFQSSFCEDRPGNRRTANLYIGGLSCYACVWLVEHALSSKFNDLECSISLSQGSLRLTWNTKETNLGAIVRLIRNLGFPVSPSPEDFAQSNSNELMRLGVSTFCFLNVMLVSVPDYIDADLVNDVKFWWLFRLMSLAFAAVVISYGSWPFYRKAYVALTQKRVSIDQSISIAVVVTFVFSMVNVLKGSGPIFFDSVCAIIALLGWGRYLQMRVMQSAEQSIRGLYDYTMQYVRTEEKIVPLTEITKDRCFHVLPGDPIPVNATVVSGSGNVSRELISGESDPTTVQPGSQIMGGSLNLTTRLNLRAEQSGADSFIHKSSEAISKVLLDRGRMSTLSDRLGAGFFGMVLLIAGGILVVHWGDSPVEAVTRAIAAILIACPCAFAVAVPLTMARCTQIGLQRGVIFKNQHAIEKLSRVTEVLFDKTGTLTRGNPEVTHCEWAPKADEKQIKKYLELLPNYSNHHAIRAIAEWATRVSKSPPPPALQVHRNCWPRSSICRRGPQLEARSGCLVRTGGW